MEEVIRIKQQKLAKREEMRMMLTHAEEVRKEKAILKQQERDRDIKAAEEYTRKLEEQEQRRLDELKKMQERAAKKQGDFSENVLAKE